MMPRCAFAGGLVEVRPSGTGGGKWPCCVLAVLAACVLISNVHNLEKIILWLRNVCQKNGKTLLLCTHLFQ